MSATTTHKSACILCSLNCGIEIEVDQQGQFVKISGDKDHPHSQGYICQKATRLNYYQHQARLTRPLKRQEDGSFAEISWDQAIQEIADKLVDIRDLHGGECIAYAGGGGQGNHFPGVFASALRAACRTPYLYSSLAQEKTGNFWVHGKLFGKQNIIYEEPVEAADYVLIIGANPMQSHGVQRARRVINDLSRSKTKTLVVIDPRITETAKKADHHLQIIPGRDALLMSAMIAIIVQEGLQDQAFIDERTVGFEAIKPHFASIPIDEYLAKTGCDRELVYQITREMAAAESLVIRSDLGIEMSYNSTLNAYLKRLLFLITGNFGRKETNHLVTHFFPLLGNSRDPEEGGRTTQVTKTREIGKLYPPNVLPLEIDNDHPKRLRALIVESANPISSWADAPAQRKAYKKLDLMVVIDIAMTETAREAHYILPAASQFEKFEATFFKDNFMHLRHPVLKPMEGTLPESEIHSRLLRAMGELPEDFNDLAALAKSDLSGQTKGAFPAAFMKSMFENPSWKRYGPVILKESLGKALPNGAEDAAFLFMSAQMHAQKYSENVARAGFEGKNAMKAAEQMFRAILTQKSGVVVSKQDMKDHWNLIKYPDKKIRLSIPELLEWLDKLPETHAEIERYEQEFPFNLIAGERRAYNANTIIRDPEWRKNDQEGFLKISPKDAEALGIEDGHSVRCFNQKGELLAVVRITDEMRDGVISLPNAYGLQYGGSKDHRVIGAALNEITDATHCDPLAKTPYHKNVRVNLEPVLS
ncbi:MAG: molybdopterin-dependent oxidoreductase [Bacteroidota bacterium]